MTIRWLIPLLLGFGINAASAFTTAYSRWWGERGGRLVTALLRKVLGIPLWVVGLILVVRSPSRTLFVTSSAALSAGFVLLAVGSVLQILALAVLRHRAAAPSVQDPLVERGPYARIRHPIYAGGLLQFIAIVLLQPRVAVLVACAIGVCWAVLQAKLEEVDLLQRLPGYRVYMARVPRFVPFSLVHRRSGSSAK